MCDACLAGFFSRATNLLCTYSNDRADASYCVAFIFVPSITAKTLTTEQYPGIVERLLCARRLFREGMLHQFLLVTQSSCPLSQRLAYRPDYDAIGYL